MPSPEQRAERFRILSALDLLSDTRDPSLDRLAHVAARSIGTPIALVTFIGPEFQRNKARVGYDEPTTSLSDSFCICALDDAQLLEVPDALEDPRFAAAAWVAGAPAVRFYAGQPIVFDGVVLGTVCVVDVVPRRLDEAGREVLRDLSDLVTDLLTLKQLRQRERLQEVRAFDSAMAAGDWLWETDADFRFTWLAGEVASGAAACVGDQVGALIEDGLALTWSGRPEQPELSLRTLMQARQRFNGFLFSAEMGGRTRMFSRSGIPWFDDQGTFAGYRGQCRDVTERVRTELRALDTDAAERASRSKSEFLSRVSHELRTPLNAILGFAQLLVIDERQRALLSAKQREWLDAIRLGGERLLALVNDMLDLARIEQGRIDVSLAAVDVHRSFQATELLLRPAAAERGIRVRNLTAPGQLSVMADERALGQVLLNLLSNALKYGRAGGHVTLRAEDGPFVRLWVDDDGAGLSAEQVAHLFQPFNRLGAEASGVQGSGLGLVISKALIERMSGSLTVSSVPDVGTSVSVSLPRAVATAAAQSPVTDGAEGDGASPDAPPVRSVVYVEDNQVNVVLVEHLLLSEPRWQLSVAATGAEGIELVKSLQPDLVLLDMRLPDMTGLDVLWALQDADAVPRLGCVALSADALPEQVRLALDSGFVDYWVKPLNLVATLDKLRVLLA